MCSVNALRSERKVLDTQNVNHFVHFVPRIVLADLRNSPARFTRTLHRHQRLLGGQQRRRGEAVSSKVPLILLRRQGAANDFANKN